MNAIKKAKKHLKKLGSPEWSAYKQSYTSHDGMIHDIDVSIRQGSPNNMSGVAEKNSLLNICLTGNGLKSADHAEFFADAPELIRELLAEIKALQAKESHARKQGNVAIQNAVEEEAKLFVEKAKYRGSENIINKFNQRIEDSLEDKDFQFRTLRALETKIRNLKSELDNATSDELCKINIANFPNALKEGVDYIVVEKSEWDNLEKKYNLAYDRHVECEQKNVIQERMIDKLETRIHKCGQKFIRSVRRNAQTRIKLRNLNREIAQLLGDNLNDPEEINEQ